MRLYDGRTDRQPETETVVLGGIKWFKQAPVFQGTDARASILYEHFHEATFSATCRNQDIPLSQRGRDHGVHRVHHKIKQDLLQLNRIARHQKQPVVQIEPDAVSRPISSL